MTIETFDFNSLGGDNPFGTVKTTGGVDNRFYKLTKDAEGRGAALIRFLPDPEMKMAQQLFKINANNQKGAEKRWVSEWSPQNIGQADPFHEQWSKLWQAGQREEARKFARQERYIANILVLKDPSNPENEGKVFLLEMSKSLQSIVQNAMMPSAADVALGKSPKNLFNPLDGYSFRLVAGKAATGFITYDNSAAVEEKSAVFASKEEAVKFIQEKCHKLSDFLKPDFYKSYDELKAKLNHVLFLDSSEAPASAPATPTPAADPFAGFESPAAPAQAEAPKKTPAKKAAASAEASSVSSTSSVDDFLSQL